MPYKDPQKKKEWDARRVRDRRGNMAVKLYNASSAGKMSHQKRQQKYAASPAGKKGARRRRLTARAFLLEKRRLQCEALGVMLPLGTKVVIEFSVRDVISFPSPSPRFCLSSKNQTAGGCVFARLCVVPLSRRKYNG